MKKVKKLSVLTLTLMISLSLATGVMASNGKGNGKGLETAPGQSVNFSKGVTTEVVVTENVTEEVRVDVETSSNTTTEPMSSTSEKIVEEVITTTEKHPTKNEYRDVVTTTTKKVTTTSSWEESTTVTTTTITETPVTITETIETTIQHQGAPGSNGKVLNKSSVVIDTKEEVLGATVVNETSEITVTKGEISTETNTQILDTKKELNGWRIGHNN